MDERILKKLYETFVLSERKGTGGMVFKYVPNEDVINRMNKVFEGNWCTRVIDKDIVDDQVIVEVQVDIYDPDHEKVYTHTGFGSQQIMRYNQGPNAGKIIDIGNAYKGALAKGIVNACTRWGVGLFKERNPYELDNVTMVADDNTPAGVAPVRAPSAPPVMPKPAAMSMPTPNAAPVPPPNAKPAPAPVQPAPTSAIPSPVPPAPTSATPPPVAPPITTGTAPANMYVNTVSAPETRAVESTTSVPVPPMMPNQSVAASVNVVQEKAPAPPTVNMPSFPAPNMAPAPAANSPAPATPDLPMSKSNGLDAVGISDVQRVALNGILTMHNANYDELAREAFDSKGMSQAVPPKENLSYEEAVVVIKYGNDKFRKNR